MKWLRMPRTTSFDLMLVGVVLALTLLGIAMVYSASGIRALDTLDDPRYYLTWQAVVILGGVGKGADFNGLAKVVAKRARAAVLIGQAADDIAAALAVAGTGKFPMIRASTLADAVRKAAALAQPGDLVLLSPACASFDMFSSADDRGDQFVALVRKLLEATPE